MLSLCIGMLVLTLRTLRNCFKLRFLHLKIGDKVIVHRVSMRIKETPSEEMPNTVHSI